MTPRQMNELGRAEALRLLGGVSIGRIVFTEHAMPAIRPVNHLLDDGVIVIRSHAGTALLSSVDSVVAYEADHVEPGEHSVSWSVIVTGILRRVTDPHVIARYEQLLLPWVDRAMDQVLWLRPEIITGFALTPLTDGPRGPR